MVQISFRISATKSELLLQRDCQNPPFRCRPFPLCPPQSRTEHQRKEGNHVRTLGTSIEASSAGSVFPSPWSLKSSSLWTAPRDIPVSHYPKVPACKEPAPIASSLFPPSQGHSSRGALTGRGAQMYTPDLCFPPLCALPGRLEVARHSMLTPYLLRCLGFHTESLP